MACSRHEIIDCWRSRPGSRAVFPGQTEGRSGPDIGRTNSGDPAISRNPLSDDPFQDYSSLLKGTIPESDGEFVLGDGAHIAVIGGGPSGSFFSYFTLKMARMMGRNYKITIFEPKNFMNTGPAGCNHCGGVISELMVQSLAVEGINIPANVVQRGINSYQLYTESGDVHIETTAQEKTIASVYRSGGPKDLTVQYKESFDNFLLQTAVREGARHIQRHVDLIEFDRGRPLLFAGDELLAKADLVVGAFGVNGRNVPEFKGLDFGYDTPVTTRTSIAEIPLSREFISEKYGNSIHLFLLPVKNIKFAALIPKNSYVALCMIGKKLDRNRVREFLGHTKVRQLFPDGELDRLSCMCLPKMNIGAPGRPFSDRVVMIGDAGSTRLYKDGIGAAYSMAKSAARTVVMHGVSKKNFSDYYMPDYKELAQDNRFGSVLFWLTDIFRKIPFMSSAMLSMVRIESGGLRDNRTNLSSILWDMFTGNERYRDIFWRAVHPGLMLRITVAALRQIFGRKGSLKQTRS